MPKNKTTLPVFERAVAQHYKSIHAVDLGYWVEDCPYTIIEFDPSGNINNVRFRYDNIDKLNAELDNAGTATFCGQCKKPRMYNDNWQYYPPNKSQIRAWNKERGYAPDYELGPNEKWEINSGYRTQWAFIPLGKSVCVQCREKQNTKNKQKQTTHQYRYFLRKSKNKHRHHQTHCTWRPTN